MSVECGATEEHYRLTQTTERAVRCDRATKGDGAIVTRYGEQSKRDIVILSEAKDLAGAE